MFTSDPSVTHANGSGTVRVLLVDDVQTLVAMIEIDLTRQGYTVFTASSGPQALEIFRRESVDIILCDLSMEGMDGLHVSKAVQDICTEKGLPKPPFVLLTGYGSDLDDEGDPAQWGVDEVVGKPVDLVVLRRLVAKIAGSKI